MKLNQAQTSIISLILVLIIIFGGGFYFVKHRQAKADAQVLTNFLIENAATPGKSSSDFAQEQLTVGDTVRIHLEYKPQKLTAVTVRFVASNGKVAKTTDRVHLDGSGTYDLDIKTNDIPADIYRVEVANQDQQTISYGELTLVTPKP